MGARVNGYDDVLADEQAWANGYLRTPPEAGGAVAAGSPIQFDGPPAVTSEPDALRDEDAGSLLRELGYTPEELSALRAAGVL